MPGNPIVGATETVRPQLPPGHREQMRVCAAVALVSLDVSARFYTALGLTDLEPPLLQRAARHAVSVHREQPFERQHRPLANMRALFLDAVVDAGDATAGARVERWLDHYFVRHLEDHRPWHDWRYCLRHANTAFEELRGPPMPIVSTKVMTQIASLLDTADIDEGIESIRQAAISDWDLEMFIRRRQNPFDAITDPYFSLSFQAECFRFMSGLPRLAEGWPAEERRSVDALALRALEHMRSYEVPGFVPLADLLSGAPPS
ncbi:MAG: hypothetical protein AAF715_19015 [Myxococcota bacterium]